MKNFLSLLLLLALVTPAKADRINTDLNGQVDLVRMSDNFIQNIKDCVPLTEEKSQETSGLNYDFKYKIIGWIGDKCRCEFISTSQVGHFINRCEFDKENLAAYQKAIQDFKNEEKISLSDAKTQLVSTVKSLISDPDVCQMKVINIDYTNDLRDNLIACEPYEKTLIFSNMDNIMSVQGKDGEKCHYTYTIKNKPIDLQKIYPDGVPEAIKNLPQEGNVTTLDCLLSDEDIKKYTDALEANMIHFEDNLDWNSGDSDITNRMLQPFIDSGSCVYVDMKKLPHSPSKEDFLKSLSNSI